MTRMTGFAATLAVVAAAPAGAQTTVHDAATILKTTDYAGFEKRDNRIAASEAYVRFLDKYLRGPAAAAPAN